MGDAVVTCTLCGSSYDPRLHQACNACPLHQGCSMTCCPNCGASNINTEASKLAKFVKRLLGEKHVESGLPSNAPIRSAGKTI